MSGVGEDGDQPKKEKERKKSSKKKRTLDVEVLGGVNIGGHDGQARESFVELLLDSQQHRTATTETASTSPNWGSQTFTFDVANEQKAILYVAVWHPSRQEHMGKYALSLSKLLEKQEVPNGEAFPLWLPLLHKRQNEGWQPREGRDGPRLHVSITPHNFRINQAKNKTGGAQGTKQLMVKVVSVTNVQPSSQGDMAPFVELRVGTQLHRSSVKLPDSDGKSEWGQGEPFWFSIVDETADQLAVAVRHRAESKDQQRVGKQRFELGRLLRDTKLEITVPLYFVQKDNAWKQESSNITLVLLAKGFGLNRDMEDIVSETTEATSDISHHTSDRERNDPSTNPEHESGDEGGNSGMDPPKASLQVEGEGEGGKKDEQPEPTEAGADPEASAPLPPVEEGPPPLDGEGEGEGDKKDKQPEETETPADQNKAIPPPEAPEEPEAPAGDSAPPPTVEGDVAKPADNEQQEGEATENPSEAEPAEEVQPPETQENNPADESEPSEKPAEPTPEQESGEPSENPPATVQEPESVEPTPEPTTDNPADATAQVGESTEQPTQVTESTEQPVEMTEGNSQAVELSEKAAEGTQGIESVEAMEPTEKPGETEPGVGEGESSEKPADATQETEAEPAKVEQPTTVDAEPPSVVEETAEATTGEQRSKAVGNSAEQPATEQEKEGQQDEGPPPVAETVDTTKDDDEQDVTEAEKLRLAEEKRKQEEQLEIVIQAYSKAREGVQAAEGHARKSIEIYESAGLDTIQQDFMGELREMEEKEAAAKELQPPTASPPETETPAYAIEMMLFTAKQQEESNEAYFPALILLQDCIVAKDPSFPIFLKEKAPILATAAQMQAHTEEQQQGIVEAPASSEAVSEAPATSQEVDRKEDTLNPTQECAPVDRKEEVTITPTTTTTYTKSNINTSDGTLSNIGLVFATSEQDTCAADFRYLPMLNNLAMDMSPTMRRYMFGPHTPLPKSNSIQLPSSASFERQAARADSISLPPKYSPPSQSQEQRIIYTTPISPTATAGPHPVLTPDAREREQKLIAEEQVKLREEITRLEKLDQQRKQQAAEYEAGVDKDASSLTSTDRLLFNLQRTEDRERDDIETFQITTRGALAASEAGARSAIEKARDRVAGGGGGGHYYHTQPTPPGHPKAASTAAREHQQQPQAAAGYRGAPVVSPVPVNTVRQLKYHTPEDNNNRTKYSYTHNNDYQSKNNVNYNTNSSSNHNQHQATQHEDKSTQWSGYEPRGSNKHVITRCLEDIHKTHPPMETGVHREREGPSTEAEEAEYVEYLKSKVLAAREADQHGFPAAPPAVGREGRYQRKGVRGSSYGYSGSEGVNAAGEIDDQHQRKHDTGSPTQKLKGVRKDYWTVLQEQMEELYDLDNRFDEYCHTEGVGAKLNPVRVTTKDGSHLVFTGAAPGAGAYGKKR